MQNSVSFAIGASGTVAYATVPDGWRLHSLEVPAAVDSTELTLALSSSAEATADASKTWLTPYAANSSLAAVNGAAFTAARICALVELLSRMTEGKRVRLTVSTQTLAVTITGHLVRTGA